MAPPTTQSPYLLETLSLLLAKIPLVVAGVMQEVFPDRNGNVRQVTVRTATSVLRRDVRKLCLLEGASDLKAQGKSWLNFAKNAPTSL